MTEPTKTCNQCFIPQPLGHFSKQAGTPDGLKYRCKTCDKRYFDEYYAKKADKVIETVKRWQEKNPIIVAEHKARYRRNKAGE